MVIPIINWYRVITSLVAFIFIGLILWGAYQFYFNKPEPIVNNHYIAMPNSNQTVNQPVNKKNNNGRLLTGVYGNNKEWGGVIGWIW
jgi:hypothetical protein